MTRNATSAESYTYYQLLGVTRNATSAESYTYDGVGNRKTSLQVDGYTYNESNQLTALGDGTTFAYDANGNMVSKTARGGTTGYTWDSENRLTQVTLPGGATVSFVYDPFGRRIRKSSGSGTTVYVYDGANTVAEYDGSGILMARYTQGAGIDEPLAMQRGGTTSYYNADGLGSVTSLTNAAGTISGTYIYSSFGQTSSTASIANPYQYTGRENDPETGLYYYRARYYDPNVGRFLSEDPLAIGGGDMNLYSYVFNNPNNLIDPTGLKRKNPVSQFLDGLRRNGNFLSNWLFESDGFSDAQHIQFHGHDFLFYGTDTPESQDMMNSAGGLYMQLLYKFKYKCKGSPQNNNFPTWAAYLTTTQDPSNTAFQVGAFSFDITDMGDGTVQYTMYNKAGWHSLTGGLNFGKGDHDRKPPMPMHDMDQYGGNVYQMFQWRGKKPCGCE